MAHGATILVEGQPDEELTAAAVIEVDECVDAPTRFCVRLPLVTADGDLPLLLDDRLAADIELAVVAETGDARACLAWGPVTGQRIELVHGGGSSALTVEGGGMAVTLDREDRVEVWRDVTDGDVVETLASRCGLTADVEPTATAHPENGHALVQRETDLALIRRLARRNGYAWWIDSGEDGTHTLHFRPPPVDATPASELVINLDEPSLTTLDIAWDAERPVSVGAAQVDPRSKQVLDGGTDTATLVSQGTSAFADIAGGATRAAWLATAADDAADLQARAGAVLSEASFFLRATGTTSARRAGAILRAATVVRLRGAGSRFSGPWLCTHVHHEIDDAAHAMSFDLVRNGWGES